MNKYEQQTLLLQILGDEQKREVLFSCADKFKNVKELLDEGYPQTSLYRIINELSKHRLLISVEKQFQKGKWEKWYKSNLEHYMFSIIGNIHSTNYKLRCGKLE